MQRVYLRSQKIIMTMMVALGSGETLVPGSDVLPVTILEARQHSAINGIAPRSSDTAHNHNSMLPEIDTKKIPPAAIGFQTARIRSETRHAPKQNTDGTGQFRITCEFSHMSFNDPIVHPGKEGASHLHVFFGNTAVDHSSTSESIRTSGNSTCAGGTLNRTGYWAPAIIDTKDGTPLQPIKILVYYKSDATGGLSIKPYPQGLKMISGDMTSSTPQRRTDFGCIRPDGLEKRFSYIPPDCGIGSILEMTINFPMCWDGVNLDSHDHKSHMAFIVWDNNRRRNLCPETHPINLPALTQKIQYRVHENGETARWRLSSDAYGIDKPGGYSIHADWINGWNQELQNTWIDQCLRANRDCHGMLLGDGTTLF